MKFNHIVLFFAAAGFATAGPDRPEGGAAGSIPDFLDTDGDGVVSELERQAFAESRGQAPDGLFHRWDTNEDGVVDEEERQDAIDELRARAENRLCDLFDSAAGDDGELSREDFDALGPVGNLPTTVADLLFGFLDGDGDEVVTKEEFLAVAGGAGLPDLPGGGGRPDNPGGGGRPDLPDLPGDDGEDSGGDE